MKLLRATLCALCLPLAASARAAVLLTDNFNVTANSFDENFQVASRQTGTLAPTTYQDGGQPEFSQVGNASLPNALLMAGLPGGPSGATRLLRDFAVNPGPGNAFVIQYDANPVLTGANYSQQQISWVAVNFGSSADSGTVFPNETNGVGFLARGDGRSQMFDNGANLGEPVYGPQDDKYHHFRIEIFDPVDGNPFNGAAGSGATVRVFADNNPVPLFLHDRPGGFSTNYVSIIGEGNFNGGGDNIARHGFDNLSLSIEPVPEPASAALLLACLPVSLLRRVRRP